MNYLNHKSPRNNELKDVNNLPVAFDTRLWNERKNCIPSMIQTHNSPQYWSGMISTTPAGHHTGYVAT